MSAIPQGDGQLDRERDTPISGAVIVARDPSAATTEFDTWSDPRPSRKGRPRASPADHALRDSRTTENRFRDFARREPKYRPQTVSEDGPENASPARPRK